MLSLGGGRTKEWLNSCINRKVTESDSPLWGDSIGVFEQSLRNGYALAHLARSLGGKECQGPIFNVSFRLRALEREV